MQMSTATVTSPPRIEARPDPARLPPRAAKKRMLVIVNPYATTVSDRLKNLVVYALQGRYEVEAVSTQAQNHATQICREAREEGYDIVVAFGGDGTLNEVANGLAGTDVPVSVLPGGSTERRLPHARDPQRRRRRHRAPARARRPTSRPRKIDLGIANGRHFVFACGAGLDATAATPRRLEAAAEGPGRPLVLHLRRDQPASTRSTCATRSGSSVAVAATAASPRGSPRSRQNSDPFTYFGKQPVRVCEGAALDNGTLRWRSFAAPPSATCRSVAARVLADGLRLADHRQIDHFEGLTEARIESISRDREDRIRGFPVQVDGDYIGDHGELDLGIAPGALTVVACERRLPVLRDRRGRGRRARRLRGRADSLAFLDIRPLFPGHTLLIPREHHEALWDLPDELVEPYFANVRTLARAVARGDGRPGRVRRDEQRRQPVGPPSPHPRRPAQPQGRAAWASSGRARSTRSEAEAAEAAERIRDSIAGAPG